MRIACCRVPNLPRAAALRQRARDVPADAVVEDFVAGCRAAAARHLLAARAEVHAVLARLAWSDHDRPVATREANLALEQDEPVE